MDILEKYKLDNVKAILVEELPIDIDTYDIIEIESDSKDELYVNESGKLIHVCSGECFFGIVWFFLKKYRKNPELLPKDLKHHLCTDSSETIYKLMQLLLVPVNSYEKFKESVDKATKDIMPLSLEDCWGYKTEKYNEMLKKAKYGSEFIFIDKKDELGKKDININGDRLPVPDCRHFYIYNNKEEKQYEIWNHIDHDTSRGNAHYFIDSIFYEEKYLYEYLLNYTLRVVVS